MTDKLLEVLSDQEKIKDILSSNTEQEFIQKLKSYGVDADSKLSEEAKKLIEQAINFVGQKGSTALSEEECSVAVGGVSKKATALMAIGAALIGLTGGYVGRDKIEGRVVIPVGALFRRARGGVDPSLLGHI